MVRMQLAILIVLLDHFCGILREGIYFGNACATIPPLTVSSKDVVPAELTLPG
jgi:hypothetical protein